MKRSRGSWAGYQPKFKLAEFLPPVLKKLLAECSWDQRVTDIQQVGAVNLVGRSEHRVSATRGLSTQVFRQ